MATYSGIVYAISRSILTNGPNFCDHLLLRGVGGLVPARTVYDDNTVGLWGGLRLFKFPEAPNSYSKTSALLIMLTAGLHH
jgi:hypothetical protein